MQRRSGARGGGENVAKGGRGGGGAAVVGARHGGGESVAVEQSLRLCGRPRGWEGRARVPPPPMLSPQIRAPPVRSSRPRSRRREEPRWEEGAARPERSRRGGVDLQGRGRRPARVGRIAGFSTGGVRDFKDCSIWFQDCVLLLQVNSGCLSSSCCYLLFVQGILRFAFQFLNV